MYAHLRVPWAFLVRDFRIDASYKAGFILRIVSVSVNVAIYYFITRVFGNVAAPFLQNYGGNYFAFVVVGVAFSDYMTAGLGSIGDSVRDGQVTGTLEMLLLSPTCLPIVLLSATLWNYAFTTLRVLAYLLMGVALGMQLGHANIPVALLSLVLGLISFNALGLFAASFVIVLKRSDPVGWALRVGGTLLAGVFYPVGVLPNWLRLIGQLLPLTHALELIRRSLLLGEGIEQLWRELLILTVLTIVLLPLGVLACRLAIRIARIDGSLSHY